MFFHKRGNYFKRLKVTLFSLWQPAGLNKHPQQINVLSRVNNFVFLNDPGQLEMNFSIFDATIVNHRLSTHGE